MSPTDTNPADVSLADDRPAREFFADWLLPLKHARLRRGLRFFELLPDQTLASYWAEPVSRSGGVQHCPLAEADASALIAALAPHWLALGQDELLTLSEPLEALRQQQAQAPAPAADARRVPSYSAYPLF